MFSLIIPDQYIESKVGKSWSCLVYKSYVHTRCCHFIDLLTTWYLKAGNQDCKEGNPSVPCLLDPNPNQSHTCLGPAREMRRLPYICTSSGFGSNESIKSNNSFDWNQITRWASKFENSGGAEQGGPQITSCWSIGIPERKFYRTESIIRGIPLK